jgi:predicted aminopeptidase
MLYALSISSFGCSLPYLARAGYEQTKILIARQDMSQAADVLTPDELQKIKLAQEARDYAEKIGLNTGKAYTTFVKIDDPYVSWLLVASDKLSFTPKTWCFPIVGELPYKGYFHKSDAEQAASVLTAQGFDTMVRGVEAYSTLGWFNDPLFSNTLRHTADSVTNTVFHELFHSTVWFPGSVSFNESAAQVFGNHANLQFAAVCRDCPADFQERTERSLTRERVFAEFIASLKSDLELLYTDTTLTDVQKLNQREAVFQQALTKFQLAESRSGFHTLNNAEILQSFFYFDRYFLFEELFVLCEQSAACYVQVLKEMSANVKTDPFTLLEQYIDKNERTTL